MWLGLCVDVFVSVGPGKASLGASGQFESDKIDKSKAPTAGVLASALQRCKTLDLR